MAALEKCPTTNFDYYQELARSAFADMLHDTERNHKYAMALKEAIETVKMSGREAHVVDIGTGSGLLAMLAARYGADSVTTIEAYSPVASIAREIIAKNGFADKIKIITKHSKYVQVGPGLDMERKANILVAEVFDTELIGEGAIGTYNSAHKYLMEENCICVPSSAKIYVQLVSSDLVTSWYNFKDFYVNGEKILKIPREVAQCKGFDAIHDIQLSQFPLSEFTPITNPLQVAQFDFTGRHPIPSKETLTHNFTSNESSKSTSIFFWWELDMNQSGSILLSCAPHWAHPDTNVLSNNSQDEKVRRNVLPWRDHWMQGCFHIEGKALKKGSNYFLRTQHDEFSWSFDIFHSIVGMPVDFEKSNCRCYFHYNSKNSIMKMNDGERRGAFLKLLANRKAMKNVLFVGDHSLIPLVAAKLLNIEKISVYHKNELSSDSLRNFAKENGLLDKIDIYNYLEDIPVSTLTDLICDPNFEEAVNPIRNITEYFQILRAIDIKNVNIYPRQVAVHAIPVSFLHLHKIRWPLQSTCEGFEHANFDAVLENASNIADENVEPFSLWEYPCFALGASKCVFSFAMSDEKILPSTITLLTIEDMTKSCNGIAFFTEWKLDDNDIAISSGPKTPLQPNELVDWKFDRQSVHLIPYQHTTLGSLKGVEIKFEFNQNYDDILLTFAYHH